jgi:hypothetical protein
VDGDLTGHAVRPCDPADHDGRLVHHPLLAFAGPDGQSTISTPV